MKTPTRKKISTTPVRTPSASRKRPIAQSTAASKTAVKTAKAKKQKAKKPERPWVEKDLSPKAELVRDWPWTEHTPEFLSEDLSPTKSFYRFFDDGVVNFIIEQTVSYAKSKGDHMFTIATCEFRAFIAILFISGYNSLPRRPMYWEPSDDVYNAAVSKLMSRNRFDQIMRYLHLADNAAINKDDKLGKVRPLFNLINERLINFFPLEKNLSVDESMIPYFGKHSMKQCICSKPIRFGFKQWVLATPLGYAVHLSPYA